MAIPLQYDRKIFANNLKQIMDKNRVKQADIARLLEVSKSTVSGYCAGKQMPRMDKLEQLAHYFRVPLESLIVAELSQSAPVKESAVDKIYRSLNERGQTEYIRYGRYLAGQDKYKSHERGPQIDYIKHYLVPAAAGYTSPIEGEDYELVPKGANTPPGADFCISIQGDSMEPYIKDGDLAYVRRDTPLREFDVGVFFVDGDVYCKQWCKDMLGTLYLLSANPKREDANLTISRDSGRNVVCFGKVILDERLPQPVYE